MIERRLIEIDCRYSSTRENNKRTEITSVLVKKTPLSSVVASQNKFFPNQDKYLKSKIFVF